MAPFSPATLPMYLMRPRFTALNTGDLDGVNTPQLEKHLGRCATDTGSDSRTPSYVVLAYTGLIDLR